MGFVAAAWERIVEWRRVLKWSYAAETEEAVERLQRGVEEEMGDEGVYVDEVIFRGFEVRVLDLVRVSRECFEDLIVAAENCLTLTNEVGRSKTTKRQRSSETRFEYENSKRLRYSDDSSDSPSSDSSSSASDSSSSASDSSDSDSDFSSSASSGSDSAFSGDEKSRRRNSSRRRYEERRRHGFFPGSMKSRRHNASSTWLGGSSKYKKSMRF